MILKKGSEGVVRICALLIASSGMAGADGKNPPDAFFCDPALTALLTPSQPLLGHYEVCTSPRQLSDLASGLNVEALTSADAFGASGPFDHAALARLYRGTRAQVARGWTANANRFESFTLVSPYPDARFTQLEPGTLVIRWTCDGGLAACRIANAR